MKGGKRHGNVIRKWEGWARNERGMREVGKVLEKV